VIPLKVLPAQVFGAGNLIQSCPGQQKSAHGQLLFSESSFLTDLAQLSEGLDPIPITAEAAMMQPMGIDELNVRFPSLLVSNPDNEIGVEAAATEEAYAYSRQVAQDIDLAPAMLLILVVDRPEVP